LKGFTKSGVYPVDKDRILNDIDGNANNTLSDFDRANVELSLIKEVEERALGPKCAICDTPLSIFKSSVEKINKKMKIFPGKHCSGKCKEWWCYFCKLKPEVMSHISNCGS